MADPVLHSVAEPPKAMEVNMKNESIDPRVAELLQSIYMASRTAATSIDLGRAVDSAKDLQNIVNQDQLFEFGLETGYEAVSRVWSDVEELAKLLDIELNRPVSYKLEPVFAEK